MRSSGPGKNRTFLAFCEGFLTRSKFTLGGGAGATVGAWRCHSCLLQLELDCLALARIALRLLEGAAASAAAFSPANTAAQSTQRGGGEGTSYPTCWPSAMAASLLAFHFINQSQPHDAPPQLCSQGYWCQSLC